MPDKQDNSGIESAGATPQDEYDVFLSHATPDKSWIRTLAERLGALGLRVFLDEVDIKPGDNWVIRLNDALEQSRYLVLVLSDHTSGRPWVMQEWTSWMAGQGPLGRLLPVQIDSVELPAILKATQAIDATDRDAQRTADALFGVIGDPATLPPDDARSLLLGRDLVFTLARDGDQLQVTNPAGESRQVPLPWRQDQRFGVAHLGFSKLHQQAVTETADRTELFRHARTLGGLLFKALFDADDAGRLDQLTGRDRPRPVVQIRSDEDLLLALPWELLHQNDRFLLREGDIDLIRTTRTPVDGSTLLKAPTEPFKLVVNVSAPEGSKLSYEAESYRITLATAERCPIMPTELGTLVDLVETVKDENPTGIHFSGHGKPGALLFENDEGRDHEVPVTELLDQLRQQLPDERRLPPFFYLASCHGNDPAAPDEDKPGDAGAAVQLHRAGVTEVVGYFGPIVENLSTRAEAVLYEAIAEGLSSRDAVRRARVALAQPLGGYESHQRPSTTRAAAAEVQDQRLAGDSFPFAWAQLVFYRRGPEWPLSVPSPPGKRHGQKTLKRSFQGFGDRKVLSTGFIGRRPEQHKIRRRLHQGDQVLVFQGLGGLGKSTLAQKVLPWLVDDPNQVCTLWCQEVEGEANKTEALVTQLLVYCRARFGLDWEGVVQQVDEVAGDDSAKRFVFFLQVLVQHMPGLVLYLDNLESLLVGPVDEGDVAAFGDWAEPALEIIWADAQQLANDSGDFYLIASCRYRNPAFQAALLPVGPLPADALFRLTEWFPALRRLSAHTRAKLINRLDGHPRAVEYANDLVAETFTHLRDRQGDWVLPEPPSAEDIAHEWQTLVAPALPAVDAKLKDNLLLQAIWDWVLDERARRFLYRMTLLRTPAGWDLLAFLGEEDEPEQQALATAERLRDSSLLEQAELMIKIGPDRLGTVTRYSLHPATARFVVTAHPDAPDLKLATHRRLGEHLAAENSRYIETDIEAGHHLFEAREYDRACEILAIAASWLSDHGRRRESVAILAPFLSDTIQACVGPELTTQLLEVVGVAYASLGEVEKAIGYFERCLAIARETGTRPGESSALGNLGSAYSLLGLEEKSIECYEQAMVIAREIGDRVGEGSSFGNLGTAYLQRGEVEKAIGYFEKWLVISRETDDPKRVGAALGSLGLAYMTLNLVEKAIEYYEQALSIVREIGDREGECKTFGNLGLAYRRLGEVGKTIACHEQGLVIAREIGSPHSEGANLFNLGAAYVTLGEVEKAEGLLRQAKAIGEQIGDPRIIQPATSTLEALEKPG
ncbi:toll/interleukin-1 receptor domain-containing protein [Pseudoxanthomonas sp.]|uniref:toll/interleukin-1 receptor domain-containing protein n=1 Tax=Pseudoxanthomonas sp. TaxID=1871049 RepID=UPI0028C499E1|nr:toll/interleukin-1 receptor domain-containing protein [Pseudoxanthomonas sp.]